MYSGQDGTVRVWNIAGGNKTQAFLQHTCIFNNGDEMSSNDLDCLLLSHVAWNSTGKLLAAAMDNMINIWQLTGISIMALYKFRIIIFLAREHKAVGTKY